MGKKKTAKMIISGPVSSTGTGGTSSGSRALTKLKTLMLAASETSPKANPYKTPKQLAIYLFSLFETLASIEVVKNKKEYEMIVQFGDSFRSCKAPRLESLLLQITICKMMDQIAKRPALANHAIPSVHSQFSDSAKDLAKFRKKKLLYKYTRQQLQRYLNLL